MRTSLLLSGIALLIGVICFATDDEQVAPKRAEKGSVPPATKTGAKTKPADQAPVVVPVIEKMSADEEAVRLTSKTLVKAYAEKDAASASAHFTTDAEYVDEQGKVFQGRKAIEESLAAFFAEHPACKLEMNIDTIRFISPGVAVEDGTTKITHSKGVASPESRYTTVHVKTDGKWLAASVRDHAPKNRKEHRAQLQELEWLVGDWVEEGDDSIVNFSCKSVDNGNYLLRQFTIRIAGQEAMTGTQRIGWDPLSGKLRTWIFDSEGGYSDGFWHRDGDQWVLKSTGVTADGQTASSTSIYTIVNAHTMTWQSVDHEIAGVQLPDSELVTIVRQAPAPLIADEQK